MRLFEWPVNKSNGHDPVSESRAVGAEQIPIFGEAWFCYRIRTNGATEEAVG